MWVNGSISRIAGNGYSTVSQKAKGEATGKSQPWILKRSAVLPWAKEEVVEGEKVEPEIKSKHIFCLYCFGITKIEIGQMYNMRRVGVSTFSLAPFHVIIYWMEKGSPNRALGFSISGPPWFGCLSVFQALPLLLPLQDQRLQTTQSYACLILDSNTIFMKDIEKQKIKAKL